MSTLKLKFNEDGTVSVDARGMKGTEKQILAELQGLAASIGGDLTVEKHVGHHHHHEKGGHHENA